MTGVAAMRQCEDRKQRRALQAFDEGIMNTRDEAKSGRGRFWRRQMASR
jgi:hypothetical protein